ASVSQTAGIASGGQFPVGTTTNTFVITDAAGNTATCSFDITVIDDEDPSSITLPLITAECSATLTAPTINDNCAGTITGTTSDPLTYSSQGSYAITWNFDDGNGNDIDIVQNIIIDDTISPTAVCQDITIQLNNTNGTASITPSQINNGSSDNCSIAGMSLSQSTFDCTDIGSNVVVLTVTDVGGNTDTCTATVTVNSPTISGGTLTGYLNNTETIADADDLVEVTACPDEPQNATFNLTGYSGNIVRWESSLDGGVNWTTIANTAATYYYADITDTTLLRAVIQIGSCQATSTIVIVSVIPPDVPPTIIGPDTFSICLGDAITVEAQSEFAIPLGENEGGGFNTANLNNLGWLVDGVASWNAGGNATSPTSWRGTNGPNNFSGRCYESPDNNKFAIAHGINGITTLETPTFNTLGLATATLEFDQAFRFTAGAWGLIELSLDGGATYPITLDPGAAYNYTGPSDSGGFADLNWPPGGPNGCRNTLSSLVDKHVSIDLGSYIGLTNLRIKFTMNSNTTSSWALENITIPQAPVDEVIEWTDGTGTVVTTGASTTITPVTPGVQTYGVTSLINGCRADGDEGTEFIDVNVSFAYAGKDIAPITGECGLSTVNLNAYDNTLTAAQNIANGAYDNNYVTGTYPGTGDAGVWSVVSSPSACGNTYSFSNVGDPRATFTGEAGTYTLRWTVAGCSFDDMQVIIDNCNTVDFDGVNDYITFDDNYPAGNNFSLEVWVKPNALSGTQALLSKRDANNLTNGYDLRLTNNTLSFNWNNGGSINSPYALTINRWYHVAVTFNSGNYRLYVDGILVNTTAGSAPSVNARSFIIGAMDKTGDPTNHYNGWIDEVRIWNTALTVDQIRQMMNQQIQNNGNTVRGEIVPLDINGLLWANLDGYYRMDLNCGQLTTIAGSIDGRLRNMNSSQEETAPLPYTSRVDGQQWATDNTWTHFNVWDAPNSLGIDGVTPIDWNIVQISHNIDSGNKNITVLGLISDTSGKELTISDPNDTQNETNTGQSLTVSHYLKLDGFIDLVGESQLIQNEGSILDVTSAGYLERDQQGTTNFYNYNYWSSPVSPINTTSNNGDYTVNGVFRDGTNSNNPLNFQWTNSYDANGSTTPITLSRRWIYVYENYPADTYADWRYLTETGTLAVGLSYTMKGSGAASSEQNYVYIGKPNNGTITTPITIGNQALVGNPYPSALDGNEFILDNIPGGNAGSSNSTDGTLYFWEHYTSNFTHILEDYEGGYATYNLTGGNAAVSPPLVSGNGTPSKIPRRYVPVAQGFYVTASNVGGNVTFHNDQRQFVREAVNTSVFIRSENPNTTASSDAVGEDDIQRVRINFKNPDGAIRPLLLGFTPDDSATDGFDYGYDAEETELLEDDMLWMVDELTCSTQGVGSFDITKQYPLGLFMTNSGSVEVSLSQLENFSDVIDVFIYDALLDTYFQINDNDFVIEVDSGDHIDRFFITFMEEDTLSISEVEKDKMVISYLSESHYIYVNTFDGRPIDKIELYNILGQKVRTWLDSDGFSPSSISVPVLGISEGTYIVKVHSEGKVFNKKVIISL
ncbi:LamG-like jellyroll fold domain-containing protein, partial [Winogradskyella sp. 3972H.M.0a.05]|uniref:LamG-like jellyroll fold domain-containing protein n=1 Tax=Winogradskyella sp. 3972H.M.0a.05 TaxID=2950277 RepID=UPI003391A182